MDLAYRDKAYEYAKRFESSYDDYDERYKVHIIRRCGDLCHCLIFSRFTGNQMRFFSQNLMHFRTPEGCSSMWNIEELRKKENVITVPLEPI